MEIRIKLMGALKAKSPPGDKVAVPESATINDVLAALEIGPQQVQIVMVNGKPQPNRNSPVAPEDELTILAPVGGG